MSEPPSEEPVLTQRWSWTHLQHRALVADVGEALVRAPTLGSALRDCCEAMVAHLNAALVRVWTLDGPSDMLDLQASAGLFTHLDGPHARVSVGEHDVGRIAASRRPHLTNHVADDAELTDREWAARQGLVAFAGYPLVIADQLVGVMTLFARHTLPSDTHEALASIADTLALGVGRLRAMSALAEQQERYRLIQRATNDPIWDWDLRSDVVSWSEAIQTTFGYPLREVGTTGHWWSETIHPDDRDRILHSIHDAIMGTADTWSDEYRFRRRDGSYATVLDRGYLRRDGRGKAHRMVGSMLDVTAQRQAAHEREQLVVALTRSNQDLDQFAYVASHDLKTPLRGIANLSQWIEDDLAEQASPELRRQLTLLRDRARRLDALIDGILDYSRAGRVRGQTETIDLATLVREAAELLAPPAAVTIESAPATLQTERGPLHHVLLHLIGNAVRHAQRPDARVTVAAREDDDGYHLTVADNGPGIAPQYHERIWGIFQTLAAPQGERGTGIGLSVVKKIVETRGGRAWVESREGEGAVFHVVWPRARPLSAGSLAGHGRP